MEQRIFPLDEYYSRFPSQEEGVRNLVTLLKSRDAGTRMEAARALQFSVSLYPHLHMLIRKLAVRPLQKLFRRTREENEKEVLRRLGRPLWRGEVVRWSRETQDYASAVEAIGGLEAYLGQPPGCVRWLAHVLRRDRLP